MIGFAIAGQFIDNAMECIELLSLHILPDYRPQGIGTTLFDYLQELIGLPLLNVETVK